MDDGADSDPEALDSETDSDEDDEITMEEESEGTSLFDRFSRLPSTRRESKTDLVFPSFI